MPYGVRLPVLLMLLLAGCVRGVPADRPDPPTPTLPTPTLVPTAAPAPTAAPPPTAEPVPIYHPRLILTAQHFHVDTRSWSPDGEWLPLWFSTAEPGGADAIGASFVPGFVNAATGEHCMRVEVTTNVRQPEGASLFAGWGPDGQATLVADGAWYRGQPCGTFRRVPAEEDPRLAPSHPSPDGRHVAVSTFDEAGGAARTTLTDAVPGAVVGTAEWQWVAPYAGGRWLDDSRYLVQASADRGPLLLDTSGGVVAVLPELFALDVPAAELDALHLSGAVDRASGNLHLLLEDVQQDGTPLLLYHAESGDVETLPFADVWHIQAGGRLLDGFTPDGGWLALRTPFGTAFTGDVSWLRAVDGQRADVFAAPHGAGVSAGDGAGRVAVNRAADWEQVDVLSLPAGEVLQSWRFEGYSLTVEAWSLDGRTLVLSGNRRAVWPDELESGPQALFLADVGDPPADRD